MSISAACPCGRQLKLRDEYAGKRVKCPACGQPVRVPALEQDCAVVDEDEPPPSPTEEPPPDAAGWGAWGPPAKSTKPRPKTGRRKRRSGPPTDSPREYFYAALVLALIPLAISLLASDDIDVVERLHRTVRKLVDAPADVQARVDKVLESEDVSRKDLLAALPEGKIEGAHLRHDTYMHWLYAALAAGVFLGFSLLIFSPGHVEGFQLGLVALFTATIGILLLLIVQFAAAVTDGVWLRGRGILLPIFYILKFIGFSYRAATDPANSFWLSLLGYTFGVGLCEEICKAAPVLSHFRRRPFLGWRGACLWGLASGIGFGVAEGISYSSDFYNGISTAGIYVVRFVSCVALHGMWSAAVGISIFEWQDYFRGETDWSDIAGAVDSPMQLTLLSFGGQVGCAGYLLLLCRVLWMPILLHGLYDTLLKKDMDGWALAVALASFAWLVWKIEHARAMLDTETAPERA